MEPRFTISLYPLGQGWVATVLDDGVPTQYGAPGPDAMAALFNLCQILADLQLSKRGESGGGG